MSFNLISHLKSASPTKKSDHRVQISSYFMHLTKRMKTNETGNAAWSIVNFLDLKCWAPGPLTS